MADFFQPGPEKRNATTTATPSPAEQALMKFKAEMLMRLLNNAGGGTPSFEGWAKGTGPLNRGLPSGMGEGMGAVLQAMAQPGAFTSQSSVEGEAFGAEPSMLSDIMQMAQLGNLVYQSGALGGLADLLKTSSRSGAAVPQLGIGQESGVKPTGALVSTGNPELDALIYGQYGGGTETAAMIPGGMLSDVPADYPGLNDDTSWLSGLFS